MFDNFKISKQTLDTLDDYIINYRKMIIAIIYDKFLRDSNIDINQLYDEYCCLDNL